MEPVIHLDDEEVEELLALARNSDRLSAIISKIAEIGPGVGTRSFARKLHRAIGLDLREVVLATNGMLMLYDLRGDHDATSEEVIDFLGSGLDDPEALQGWKDAKPKIIQALDLLNDTHPLVLSHEAGAAASSRSNIVLSMQVYTDARPVFNEARDHVLFTVISHTLSLEYHAGYRQHREINLSLDAVDIKRLKELCEEADAQAAALKANISGPASLPLESEAE